MKFVWPLVAALALAAAQEHLPQRRILSAARVSAESPFVPGCDGPQSGTNYRHAAVEAWLAADPRNPLRLIGAWQQDRWSNGSAVGLMAAVTLDGGATWRRSPLPFGICAGGDPPYARASDPWVSIGPDGTAFAAGLATAGVDVSALLVSHSADGLEWSRPVKLIEETNRDVLNDKEAITADPTDARYVYAVWDRLSGLTATSANSYRGPSYFARSTDGGASWEQARPIYDPGGNAQTIGNQIVVLPDGTLIDAFTLIRNATSPLVPEEHLTVAVMRSTNKGATWSAPVIVATEMPVGVSSVKTGVPVRSGALVPEIAVDALTGELYIVWQDGRFSGGMREGIAMSRSTDGGLTWSAVTQVNQATAVQAFTPVVAARGGEVAVTYYDFRKDTDDPKTLLTSYWRATSEDGGRTWSEAPMAEPFDLALAAVATGQGYFIGDYQGLAAVNGRFLSFFVMSGAGPARSSVYASYRPTGGDVRSNGRTEVNRYVLRRHIERRRAK